MLNTVKVQIYIQLFVNYLHLLKLMIIFCLAVYFVHGSMDDFTLFDHP